MPEFKEEEPEALYASYAKDAHLTERRATSASVCDGSPHLSSVDSMQASPLQRPVKSAGSASPSIDERAGGSTSPARTAPPQARGEARHVSRGTASLSQEPHHRGGSPNSDTSSRGGGRHAPQSIAQAAPAGGPKLEASSSPETPSSTGGDDRGSPMPHLSLLSTSKSAATEGASVTGEGHVRAMDVPAAQPPGCSRVGGQEWVLRRKNETQNLAFRSGMTPKELQVANVRKAVARLQAKLPVDAKARFLVEMRRYGAGDAS
eukprot:CAMPEP_0173399750 /NCGR_PEP_ID=MMETSP1356-20130122/45800_1 /TAXON_ID=77927 ORGANISM="Hemiselmis virescens, Strain PCC157" /NCGR_SAMPLE_ID=MMETSP1356 /ASSEMBLY_ACC=CAM_ASM_000847 /LENGTH=261 /DNA_ID=CAMNT_0014359517 /DNA_START=138 /DNA_END=919 /DNA_ORIENTATION=+